MNSVVLRENFSTLNRGLFGVYLRLACVPLIWGGTFIAGRIVSGHMQPSAAAFIRFIFASVALLIAMQLSVGLKSLFQISRYQLLATVALAGTGICAYNLLFFFALTELPAGRTALVVALNPVITLVLSAVILREHLSLKRWCGMLLGLVGVWVVVTQGDLSQLLRSVGRGEAAMFGAAVAWAAYTLLGRVVLRGLSPLVATTWAALWGAVFLGLYSLFSHSLGQLNAQPWLVWWSLVFLGVFGTAVAFVWYFEGLRRLGAARTVIFNNLVPVFGVLLSWLLLQEDISFSMIWGGGLALTGVFLVNHIGSADKHQVGMKRD
jgi:drug/metabolite transporter (DMT)-like permease